MFKKTLIAAAIAGVTILGATTAATAKDNGYKNGHQGNHNYSKNYNKHGNYNKHHKHGRRFGFNYGGFPPHLIRNMLQMRGFYKIRFKDRHLPVYVVKACKRGHRFKIGLNRWGKILWKKPRGHCHARRDYIAY